MDDAFLEDLVAKAAQHLCLLSTGACDSDVIYGTLELIWDVSLSPSATETMASIGCIEICWGITFRSSDDRVQELCLGALANMCLQTECCSRLLDMPHAAVACVSLCVPDAGMDVRSGSYVQALRLSRVILGKCSTAPQRQALLEPLAGPNVCRQIVEAFPEGASPSDSELQAALIDLQVYIMDCAAECCRSAQIADNFIAAGAFRIALQAARGAASDVPQIARFLSSCQNYAHALNLCDQCNAASIITSCVAMLGHPSLASCAVAMVRRRNYNMSFVWRVFVVNPPQVILANALRHGAVTAAQLLDAPVSVQAILGCDHLLCIRREGSEDSDDGEVAVWYVAASICIAADAALCHVEDVPPSVGALALQLALSATFLAAVCAESECRASPKSKYIAAAASPAFKVINAAACSALAALPLDEHHPWACGADYLEQAESASGHTMLQLLLLARDKLSSAV
jgi:hypothetical protein